MAITNATIKHFNTRSNYDNISQRGGISQGDLVFIKDRQQIITHGQVYDCGNYEANLKWGGKNFADNFGPIDAAIIPELGANRFAFLNPAGITLEYSKDGGNTWTEETAVFMKESLFGNGNTPFFIGQRDGGKDATSNWKNRITLNAYLCGLYCEFKKIAIWMSTEGSGGCRVLIEYSDNGESWSRLSDSSVGGWSGWNIIQTATTRFGNTIYSDAKYLRFTFSISVANANYRNLHVDRILAFGGTAWTTPSNMASTGHLYNYDEHQNAIFPAEVTATKLNGNLDWSYIQNKPSSYDTAWIEY